MDLKDLFVEELIKGSFSEFLEKMVNQSNSDEQKESFKKTMKNFDNLCKRIEMNFYEKIDDIRTFADIFFNEPNPKYFKFLNRFYMIKLFFELKDNKKVNYGCFSIINEKNLISKKFLSHILKLMATFKTILDTKKY